MVALRLLGLVALSAIVLGYSPWGWTVFVLPTVWALGIEWALAADSGHDWSVRALERGPAGRQLLAGLRWMNRPAVKLSAFGFSVAWLMGAGVLVRAGLV